MLGAVVSSSSTLISHVQQLQLSQYQYGDENRSQTANDISGILTLLSKPTDIIKIVFAGNLQVQLQGPILSGQRLWSHHYIHNHYHHKMKMAAMGLCRCGRVTESCDVD